jgi:Conserved protein/domain typically associated with flavoprotein oxygenases, DIM6/NTAB family
MSQAVADAFKYEKLVLATTTYNADIFPFMREFIEHLTERKFQNRIVALIENGSWSPMAVKIMKGKLNECKNIEIMENSITIRSGLSKENAEGIKLLAEELCKDYIALDNNSANKNDISALNHIGYGLYVVTTKDNEKDNGLIVNTVTQVSDNPNRIAVTINKANYSHHIIKQTGVFNINCLSQDAPFAVFERFGFHSGQKYR